MNNSFTLYNNNNYNIQRQNIFQENYQNGAKKSFFDENEFFDCNNFERRAFEISAIMKPRKLAEVRPLRYINRDDGANSMQDIDSKKPDHFCKF